MGYARNNTKVKAEQQPLEASPDIKKSNLSIDQSFIELEDSFLDSLLNFDGWVEDHPNSSLAEVMNSQENSSLEHMNSVEVEVNTQKDDGCESEKLADLGSLIQEQIGRVCLTSGAEVIDLKQETSNPEVENVKENEVKDNAEKGKDDDEDVDTGEDESSSSSSSSSDDDDDESTKDEVEMEEGEIRDEMIGLSDDDEDGDIVKGPIRSANEVQDLPPVPPVTVTIQPHHQTLPVGAVLSIMGSQVVVEGVENHNPLSEGSILWITEIRSPLGVVDEIFGPVKNPYYIVRYNSETEIPVGIEQGSLISFVPEFADYVLNNNNLYKKGYDASGENDEECSEELEFSDDEKEAEYKRKMKMAKRGSAREKNGPKKSRNRGGKWKNDQQPSPSRPGNGPTSGPNNGLNTGPNNGPNAGPNNGPNTGPNNGPNTGPNNGPSSGPYPFSQAPNIMQSGVWPYGFSPFPPQNMGFPPNGPPFMQPNFIQQPFQNPQIPGPMFPGNFVQGVPPNFGAFASWPSGMPQNNFNQSQAGPPMMFPGLPQGVSMPNGLQMESNNGGVRPFVAAGNVEASQKPNQGNRFTNRGGRSGPRFQRGGGRFRGGGRSGPRS